MAATLILRTVKGTPLSNLEVDNNFSNLNIFGDVVSANVDGVRSNLTTTNSNIGVLANLTTTAKSNLVSAINEIESGKLNQFASTTSAELASVISDETGSGSLVFATSPTLVTPVLGVATGTSVMLSANVGAAAANVSGVVTGGTLNTAGNVNAAAGLVSGVLTAGTLNTAGNVNAASLRVTTTSSLGTVAQGTWNGTSISTTYTDAKVTSVNGSTGAVTGLATTGGKLSQFAATTSAELAGVISDETGSGSLVFGTSPSISNPTITGTASMASLSSSGTATFTKVVETAVALGNTGTAITINLSSGTLFTATLTGNCTFTISNPTGVSSFVLVLTNDATAGRSVAFSGGTFRYPNGSVARTTTANATDIWFFFTPNGGTTWYVSIPMSNVS